MARQARIIIPHSCHHVSQRGNRGDNIFFEKADYQYYLSLLKEQLNHFDLSLYSYTLLPNQIHLLLEPKSETSLSRAIGETNRQYTRYINQKHNWTGHLFQNRFFSYAMDEQYALRAARFIETLPVTAMITDKPQNFLWSSAKFRIKNIQNDFLKSFRTFHIDQNWEEFLDRPMDQDELKLIQTHLQTGRPRGGHLFLDRIEDQLGKPVRPQKRGRKPKSQKKQAANA
ncbi:MAG: transposase [Pseudomonadota bacterium]